MEISRRTMAASAGLAAAGVVLTQNTSVSMTAPVAIGPELMRAILPIVLAVVPILLQQFAPGLVPLWERLKSLFFPNPEAADYAALSKVAAIKPDCPIWQGHCRELAAAIYAKHHAPASVAADPVPVPVVKGGAV